MKKNDTLIPAICPQCGAKIELGKNLQKGYCSFCGTEIINKEALKNVNAPTFENYIILADRAYDDGNYETALNHYISALKINPNDLHAIYREGFAKSLTGGFDNFDIKSAVDSCENVKEIIDFSEQMSKDEKIQIQTRISTDFFAILQFYINEINFNIQKSNTSNYVTRLLAIREAARYLLNNFVTDEFTRNFSSTSENEILKNGKLTLLRMIIQMNSNACSFEISKELRQECVKDYDLYVKTILEINPKEEIPKIKRKEFMTRHDKEVIIGVIVFIIITAIILALSKMLRPSY